MLAFFVCAVCVGGAVYGLQSLNGLSRLMREQAQAQRAHWQQERAERLRGLPDVFQPLPMPNCVGGPGQGNASMPGGCW